MNLYAKAYWSNNPIPVNQQINNPDFIINVPIGVIVGSGDVTKSYVDQQDAALSAQIDTKLDASDYVQHFRGVFVNLAALQAAIPVGINGDYAHIDLGVGFDRKVAIWDTDDNKWIESTGSVALTTDEVTEGNTNKYFTDLRVRNTVLSGLVKTDQSNVTNTDTVEVAVGKLAAKSESGVNTNWVPASTVGVGATGLDISLLEFAKINGMLFCRGFIKVNSTISGSGTVFTITNNNYKVVRPIIGTGELMSGNLQIYYGTSNIGNIRFLVNGSSTNSEDSKTSVQRLQATTSLSSSTEYFAVQQNFCFGQLVNP